MPSACPRLLLPLFLTATSLFSKLVLHPVSPLFVKKKSAMGLCLIVPVLITGCLKWKVFSILLWCLTPLFPTPTKPQDGIYEDGERSPSLSLSKVNVIKVGSSSFNMLSFHLFCLPACPGQRLNSWEHGKSWLSRLTTINHLTLHVELVCTRYVKSKEPHLRAGLTAGNIFPSQVLCPLLFKSKSGGRIGLAKWVAPVENKLCVGSHPAKFMWNCPF